MPYVGSFDSIYIQEAVFERNQVDFQRNDVIDLRNSAIRVEKD